LFTIKQEAVIEGPLDTDTVRYR